MKLECYMNHFDRITVWHVVACKFIACFILWLSNKRICLLTEEFDIIVDRSGDCVFLKWSLLGWSLWVASCIMLSASRRIVKPLIAEELCGKLILLNGPQLTVPLWTKTWVMSRISIKFPSNCFFWCSWWGPVVLPPRFKCKLLQFKWTRSDCLWGSIQDCQNLTFNLNN